MIIQKKCGNRVVFFLYKATLVKADIKNKLSTIKYTDYIPSGFRIGGGASEDVYN